MNTIEDRLKDAIAGAAQTVSPAVIERLEETIRQGAAPLTRGQPQPGGHRPRPGWRAAAPVAAAAALACVAALFALLTTPGARHPHHHGAASGWALSIKGEPKFIVVQPLSRVQLQVRSATTGVVVAHVRIPPAPPDKFASVSAIATANGHSYLVATDQVLRHSCRSWLYQFTINDKGQPSAVTPFASMPTIAGTEIGDMAISSNGRWLAFTSFASGFPCGGTGWGHRYINFTNMQTGHTKRWPIPINSGVTNVSLTADGGQLLFGYELLHKHFPVSSEVRVFPTSALPGSVATLGHAVVRSAQFGPHADIAFATITPGGQSAYFSEYPALSFGPGPGKIWDIGLAGGHARLIAGNLEFVNVVYADVHVRYLLLHIHNRFSRLTLATGKVTVLPRIWHHIFAVYIAW
jgi:hypothetical protein